MEWKEVMAKAGEILSLAEELKHEAEPCVRANAESIYAHAKLLCNELGLDAGDYGKGE